LLHSKLSFFHLQEEKDICLSQSESMRNLPLTEEVNQYFQIFATNHMTHKIYFFILGWKEGNKFYGRAKQCINFECQMRGEDPPCTSTRGAKLLKDSKLSYSSFVIVDK
jgi:hypothetical protein